ncbi:MAG: histidinol-phosphate transaminase [Ruminococcaceae bacterium]|nr:histidinol-phosphate transaminase [Oscillospiraceae bacterium]
MSRFFSDKYASLTPYTPGEQPKDMQYVKLNTNESPFPPSDKAIAYAARAAASLQLYSDPESRPLTEAVATLCGVSPREVLLTNGSDEILNFAFMAFCDEKHPAVFPDITYGFYKVFAEVNGIPYRTIPLRKDMTVDVDAYCETEETVFLANPNAPTGIALPVEAIERIVRSNPNRVVVIDEAYVDFGAESCLPLVKKYDNLLVTQTFSKSRSLAGGRLGFGVGCEALIRDLNTLKYSTNPYNVNRMTMAAGLGVLEDEAYTRQNCRTIEHNRAWLTAALEARGFTVIPSKANFILAAHPALDGGATYRRLKEMGILVRHFDTDRLSRYNRITVGSLTQLQALVAAIDTILEEAV